MATKIYSVKAELSVLRALFHKKKEVAGTILSSVDSSYFYSDEAKEIYERAVAAVREDGAIPKYRLFLGDPELSDSAREFLRESQPVVTSVLDAKRAVKTLGKYRVRRGLHDIMHRINEGLQDGRGDVAALLKETSEALQKVGQSKATAKSFLHFGKYNNSKDFVHDLLYGEESVDLIPTGLKGFDDMNSGLGRGGLHFIAGNSGAGKSHTAMAVGKNMATAGYKVLFIPLEMNERECSSRLLANLAKVDSLKIWSGKDFSDKERKRVEKCYNRWIKLCRKRGGDFAIYKPDSDITIEEALAGASTYGVDVVIIDYISLLSGADGDDQWRALGRMARYAKIDAEINNRLNILVAQLSDEGRLKYSQTMKEHANNMWAFTADRDDKESGLRRVEQIKARNQKDYPFTIKIEMQYSRVTTVDSDYAPGDRGDPKLPNLANESDI